MKAKHIRLWVLLGGLSALATGLTLVVTALNENILFFRAPADLQTEPIASGVRFRLGGLVEEGSVKRLGPVTEFTVTDGSASITVIYDKLLPDLFREGQGVVTEGWLSETGQFEASLVLARHDETYMPPEVADALKKHNLFNHMSPNSYVED